MPQNEKPIIQKIKHILSEIPHPVEKNNLMASNAVKDIKYLEKEKRIEIQMDLGNDRKIQLATEAQIRTAIVKDPGPPELKPKIKFVFIQSQQPPAATGRKLKHIKYVVAVGSGKGGVGKSTVALNLACSLSRNGFNIGLMDADIYGPSLGKLVSMGGKIKLDIKNNKIMPKKIYGIKLISFSFLIEEDQAVVWRGPMLGKAVEQFFFDVDWGTLDYLIVDLPPGTGDVHLSIGQLVEVSGAVIVTTPQDVATQDAHRAVKMFEQVNIPLIGVIENMSQFICPHCRRSSKIFSEGGGKALSNSFGSNLLAEIPLAIELMQSCEKGIPITSKDSKKLKFPKGPLEDIQNSFQDASQNIHTILEENYAQ